jgi:hypothetical protein
MKPPPRRLSEPRLPVHQPRPVGLVEVRRPPVQPLYTFAWSRCSYCDERYRGHGPCPECTPWAVP